MEIWKPIPGFEDYYEASNLGRIRSKERMYIGRWGTPRHLSTHVLKTNNTHNGYLQVKFSIDGVKYQPLVHRLVASTFIANPLNLPQVNHKDGDATNNNAENLEWCTASQNAIHRCHVLKHCSGKPRRKVLCKENKKIYESSHHAARELEINQGGIFNVCNGKQKSTRGLHFKFVD